MTETLDKKLHEDEFSYVGFPVRSRLIFVVTCFLYGIVSSSSFSAEVDGQVQFILRLMKGFGYAVVGGVVISIYAWFKSQDTTGAEKILSNYVSYRRAVLFTVASTLFLIIFKIYTVGASNVLIVFDILIVASLGLAFYKKVRFSTVLVLLYALGMAFLAGFSGTGVAGGVLWAFGFAFAAHTYAIERRFASLVGASPS